ncbi:4-alpha-glucanotransferase [Marivita sp. S0852]|uniref:4-alpha-glucanotransferase n=1 Tax=Marivita sp. S0852 TaxID=3373893 RepID=UPI0039822807
MNAQDDKLRALAQAHGIHLEFHDLHGHRHVASPDTLKALLTALGVDIETQRDIDDALTQCTATPPSEKIVFAGQSAVVPTPFPCTWSLLDDAGRVVCDGRAEDQIPLPALKVGYFNLHIKNADGHARILILSRPHRAPDLASRCTARACWGSTGALYGLRSSSNGGLGNYADLGKTTQTLGRFGAQFFGINPVHALGWAMDTIISPYSPSHRGMFNTDHIATSQSLGPTPNDRCVDYSEFRKKHRPRLEQDYQAFKTSGARSTFEAWKAACGQDVHHFAQFEAISETHGYDFRTWPTALRSPGTAVVKAAGPRADFHLWLQWRASAQIHAAQRDAKHSGMALGLYLDLAVGPRPEGAEVWMNAATIAKGVTIGAPPDHLSPEGQSWALAAHAPGPLAKAQYAPLRLMLRRLMQTCGLLRIDHALGLLRSYWLPDDGSPGGYIKQPFDSLLAVILIEAHQTGCSVVGEDLGLVPNGFRDTMNSAGLYSYAVWQFETNDAGEIHSAAALPRFSLACFGTHDTPTLQGFWHGTDIDWWQKVGWLNDIDRLKRHAYRSRQRQSLRSVCGLRPDASAAEVSSHIHSALAQSPAALVSVQMDDIFGEVEAQNLPGTIDAHPNWRRRLPIAVEDMGQNAALRDVAQTMNMHRQLHPSTDDTDDPKEVSA